MSACMWNFHKCQHSSTDHLKFAQIDRFQLWHQRVLVNQVTARSKHIIDDHNHLKTKENVSLVGKSALPGAGCKANDPLHAENQSKKEMPMQKQMVSNNNH